MKAKINKIQNKYERSENPLDTHTHIYILNPPKSYDVTRMILFFTYLLVMVILNFIKALVTCCAFTFPLCPFTGLVHRYFQSPWTTQDDLVAEAPSPTPPHPRMPLHTGTRTLS